MTTLTPAQVAHAAAKGGFTGDGLVKAVAVALAESGGVTTAVGVNSDKWRSRDRGLWQINDHWHPDVSDAQAFSSIGCAQAAYRISKGGRDWSPWSTWKNGAAAAQMGRARLAVAQAGGSSSVTSSPNALPPGVTGTTTPTSSSTPTSSAQPVGLTIPDWAAGLAGGVAADVAVGVDKNPLNALGGLLGLAMHAAEWMSDSHNWARVAMVGGGTVGILIGVSMIARSGAAGSTVAGAAKLAAPTNLIPIAKVAKVAKAAGK